MASGDEIVQSGLSPDLEKERKSSLSPGLERGSWLPFLNTRSACALHCARHLHAIFLQTQGTVVVAPILQIRNWCFEQVK